jgi:hypothetical protein
MWCKLKGLQRMVVTTMAVTVSTYKKTIIHLKINDDSASLGK